MMTLGLTPSSSRQSASSVRGYFSRSVASLNWVGLTKMDTTVCVFSDTLRATSERCPSCSAPIVGTKPSVVVELAMQASER